MNFYKKMIILLIALFATGCMTISTNGDYTLQSGQTLRGDLIITSGEATVEEGSRVTGDIFMSSGTLNIDGEVEGDIVYSSAKSINLGSKSVVGGDIKGSSGDVYRSEGAQVDGKISGDNTFTLGVGFFAKMFGILCGIPLALIGSVVYLITNRRRNATETNAKPADSEAHDIPTKLKQLKQMKDDGLISEEDYEAKKADLLAML